MPIRVAIDQHSFKHDAYKHNDKGHIVGMTYFSRFCDVFADIEDVKVGDEALVMYVESVYVADGRITDLKPDKEEAPWMGGTVYIDVDMTTTRAML